MFVVKIHNVLGEVVNHEPMNKKPSNAEIKELIETFDGDYATVEQRHYADVAEETGGTN